MAIEFDCPNCKTHYRLKDEFGGKTATCKNPNCRKVIPIPKPTGAVVAAATPADLDALAAAAFSDEPAKAAGAGEMIQVTCSGCDHVWSVEASKEGKNVLCPECRKPNRVPLRKKEEKADWRTGGGGPSMAKRETGMDREGAFATATAAGISTDTAREIVKGREAEEEPEERRKRLLKRGALLVLVLGIVGTGLFFALKTRREIKIEENMADAVKERAEKGVKDQRFEVLMWRASSEQRARTAGSSAEATEALKDLQKARNRLPGPSASGSDADRLGLIADIATTIPQLAVPTGGDPEKYVKKEEIHRELRLTIAIIADTELAADVVRRTTREFAKRGQPTAVEEIVRQPSSPNATGPDLAAQVGLELARMAREPGQNADSYRSAAEEVLKRLPNTDTPGAQALRLALGKPAPAKKEGETPAAQPTPAAIAEAEAIKGNVAGATAAKKMGKPEDRAKVLATVGQTLAETNPTEAKSLLVDASRDLKTVKNSVSPWVSIRVCYWLAKLGDDLEAESLAASLPDDQSKAWGRLEALRGRLDSTKGKKGEDAWLDAIGDPTKLAAAAKAREVMARHNVAEGAGDYQSVVRKWTPGDVRPFGTAGLILGQLDKAGK
jgi:hypothetical protein